MAKGKGQAEDLGKVEFESLGKMVGLLLRITGPIWNNTGWDIILHSGFCVLSGIVELAKRGVAWQGLDQEALLQAKVHLGQINQSLFCREGG
jgi:hypothetical protein